MMNLKTNLKGRLRNTDLRKCKALFPLYEAVVNSIHSIDDSYTDLSGAYVKIIVERGGQLFIQNDEKLPVTGFCIIDNGIGFNNDNYKSFQTLDSDYKENKGCRGIGRLIWLKAFDEVAISSVYNDTGILKKRSFKFNAAKSIFDDRETDFEDGDIETKVHLYGLKSQYSKYVPKTVNKIAADLLEHCLWYFFRDGGAPKITVSDGDDCINLFELYKNYMADSSDETLFTIKGSTFSLTHIKLSVPKSKHTVLYCASDRVVKEENLEGKIIGLFGKLEDGEKKFSYLGLLNSSFLDEHVVPERTGFNIPEKNDGFLDSTEISFSEVREHVLKCVDTYLSDYLAINKKRGKRRVTDFVNRKSPRYKPILKYFQEKDLVVDPNIKDKDLELKLHSCYAVLEKKILEEGHDLLVPKNMEKYDYSDRVCKYLSKVASVKKSDLAAYVTHRRVIIDLLRNCIASKDNGKYQQEDVIHNLIMPMRKSSEDFLSVCDCNLWLIDERLAFHSYLASDKTLRSMEITGSKSTKEPDLIAFDIFDNPILANNKESLPLASINIIEIKRPMRNDAGAGEKKDPIEQAISYLQKVRSGKVKTANGRLIPKSDDIPGFCYILSDLTDSVITRCQMWDLTLTADKLGYFGYNKNYKSYIEVISFDRLVNSATERNKAFFDKLGLPTVC